MKALIKLVSLIVSLMLCLGTVSCKTKPAVNGSISDADETASSVPSSGTQSTDTDNISADFALSETMPSIHIVTADGSNNFATKYKRDDKLNDRIEYTEAFISTKNCEKDFMLEAVEAEVKVRGNYTLNYDKKPLRIKFSKKQNLFGLHDGEKYKNWVLLADWKDLSMLNNITALYLGKQILGADGYYCSDFKNVEVYLNGEYWGVYLLVEQQEVKDGRFSVSEVPDNYTGTDVGYMFEFDSYYTEERNSPNGDPTFEISYNGAKYTQIGYTVKSDINSAEQLNFLKNYVENAFLIAYSAVNTGSLMEFNSDFSDIKPSDAQSVKECVGKVIDLDSLIDAYILNEVAYDSDIAWSSFYIAVDMSENGSKKLIFEAPWDFDSAFGMRKGYTRHDIMVAKGGMNPWLGVLADEQWFTDAVKERWAELTSEGLQDKTLKLIKDAKEIYKPYYDKNYKRWSKRITHGNGEVVPELNKNLSQGRAADFLYNWLNNRFEYLNRQWK